MLDKDIRVIRGILTEDGQETYINAQYWGDIEVEDLKTIGGKTIFKKSDIDDDDIAINAYAIIEIEYSDLKKLREESGLTPGIQYRITDYITTTKQANTKSAGHQFDIIVTADGINTLNDVARVCLHKGDQYFISSKLDSWEIKYCLDNDVNRFTWADENGKGVIYYMKDEYNNEVYYDFKNIMYDISSYETRPTYTESEYDYNYAFTFTESSDKGNNDLSLKKNVRNNIVNKLTNENGVQSLNSTIFICTNSINDNKIEENSCNNFIWASSFYNNNIGREFQNNIILPINYINDSKASFNNNVIDSLFKNNKITYQISRCEFGSDVKSCVFENTDRYEPSVNEMKWCVFEGGIYGGKYIPCCQRVTFQKAFNEKTSNFEPSNITLIDGRIMSDVLTRKHGEHLYVYRVGDKFAIYKNSEERIKTLTPIFSNPNLNIDDNNIKDGFGYVGYLHELNVIGNNILIDSIGVYVNDDEDSSQNFDVQIWCRLLKYSNETNKWELISKSETCKRIDENVSENLFTFKMVNKSNDSLLKNGDKIAIVYVSNENEDVYEFVNLGFKTISDKSGGLSIDKDNVISDQDWMPAFVFGYTSVGSETSEINLGHFINIEDVYSKISEIDIYSDMSITKMFFLIEDDDKNVIKNGFIEQFIYKDENANECYNVTQVSHFNGEISSRQIVYTINNEGETNVEIGSWYKIIDNNGSTILYSENSEVVNINSNQTITGIKQFENGIKFSKNNELKIFNENNDNSVIISTNGNFDDSIPKLELSVVGDDNNTYTYQFPKLSELNKTDVVVVETQLGDYVKEEEVQENEKVTAYALVQLNDMINELNDKIIKDFIKNVTYNELIKLKRNNALIPGVQYRIKDYVTTTTQENTKSAGHQFDIIVTADTINTLNDVARACLNENDDNYFYNSSNLNCWKIWYCLDNDTSRFSWADEKNGKGVIYRMIDEWGNDCPYDFKNIQFFRKFNKNENWFYTFSWEDENEINDSSIFGNEYLNSETSGNTKGVYDNVIGKYIVDSIQCLNDIVFVSTYEYRNGLFEGCYLNTFGNNCYSNTLGNECYSNTFGNNCYSNTLGNECYSNTFGNNCYSNTLEDICYSNTFGQDCCGNILYTNCTFNIFGDFCCENEFGNSCSSNCFGYFCVLNTFGEYCVSNTFGNECNINVFKNNCCSNTFGNKCESNYFDYECVQNIFGDSCISNKFEKFYKNIELESGCEYIHIINDKTSYDYYLQNVRITNELKGTDASNINIYVDVLNSSRNLIVTKNSNGDVIQYYEGSIKTINGESLIGDGDIVIKSGIEIIKTIDNQSLIGPGNISLKTINNQSLIGDGDISIQSGTGTISIKTINGESLLGDGNIQFKTINGNHLIGEGDIIIESGVGTGEHIISLTYSDLKDIRDRGGLIPGMKYRITDYQCILPTIINMSSANNQFDIIVTADSNDTLSHLAKAALHEGDIYFASCDLNAWQLWYDIDNNIDKYEWADEDNGKGVIYRMIDEHGNDCPYDFKNILFFTELYNGDNENIYTFTYFDNLHKIVYDYSVYSNQNENLNIIKCCNNIIKEYVCNIETENVKETIVLNKNIFYTFDNTKFLRYNILGYGCNDNIFIDNVESNTLGDYCVNNTLESHNSSVCKYNTIGNCCERNIILGSHNILGNGCADNYIHDCEYNSIGNYCSYNRIWEYSDYNTFGNGCEHNFICQNSSYNTFGNGCKNVYIGSYSFFNTFGNGCYNIFFCKKEYFNLDDSEKDIDKIEFVTVHEYSHPYYRNIIFESGNSNIYLVYNGKEFYNSNFDSHNSGPYVNTDEYKFLQNVRVGLGFNKGEKYIIENDQYNQSYETYYTSKNSKTINKND